MHGAKEDLNPLRGSYGRTIVRLGGFSQALRDGAWRSSCGWRGPGWPGRGAGPRACGAPRPPRRHPRVVPVEEPEEGGFGFVSPGAPEKNPVFDTGH